MKRSQIKQYFKKQYDLLREQEEEDPFAEDTPDDAEEDAGEAEAEGEEGEEENKDSADEEKVEIDEEDEQRFQKSIDDQLQALLIDIESDAIKSAAVQAESYSLKRIYLNESSDLPLDTDKFASEVARLILNFDAFLDLETMLLSKVRSFLTDKHGEEIADEVEKLLSDRHDLARREKQEKEREEVDDHVPLAVGATPGAGV